VKPQDWAAVVSSAVAFLSMLGASVGWLLALREKRAAAAESSIAAEHTERAVQAAEAAVLAERRSADAAQQSAAAAERAASAGERAAAAQEALVSAGAAADAAELQAPWSIEPGRGSIVWNLRNRLPRRTYGVVLAADFIKSGSSAAKIDGKSSHEFMVVNGEGRQLTVTWHWEADLSDTPSRWTGLLQRC